MRLIYYTAIVLACVFCTPADGASLSAEQLQRAQEAVDRINLYRKMHGLSAVPHDQSSSAACYAHADYLDQNPNELGNPYTENSALPGSTPEGKAVAPISLVTTGSSGADSVTAMFNSYGFRGFFIAGDLTKTGYGDAPNDGFPIAVVRVGDIHKPQNLLSPPPNSKGNAVGTFRGADIVLYGATATSVSELLASSITAGGSPLEHTSQVTTTSGSRPDAKHDIVLTPNSPLPVNSLISVVIDYKENGATKKAEWSFSTSETGTFDPVAAAASAGGGNTTPVDPPSDTSDADADGFPANVENAAKTSPTDAASTPFANQTAPAASALALPKLQVKLNFAKRDSDSLSLSGTLPVAADFTPDQKQVIVDVSGIARAFTLDIKGKGTALNTIGLETQSFKLAKPKNLVAKYQLKLARANLRGDLDGDGLTNADNAGSGVKIPVAVYFTQAIFTHEYNATYKAKANRTGMAK
ncbi:MAG TPA: CAP domain-containing protein [Planctomycetota bacterium]|nr:CAP domain-containing protein [Planctomycetota bacterium]